MNIWFYTSIIEFAIIILMTCKVLHRTKSKSIDTRHLQDQKSDKFGGVFKVFDAINKHDELLRICHPDLFIDDCKKAIATDLFQQVRLNKSNFIKLLEIEAQIKKDLLDQ